MRTGCLVLFVLLALIAGGLGLLMVIDLPTPGRPVERTIPDDRLPK